MKKKYLMLMLASAFVLGTIVAAVPVKAAPLVRFFVQDPTDYDNVYASVAVGATFTVRVYVETPPEWTGTSDGITAYTISARVNPRILEPLAAVKVTPLGTGWLESFMVATYGSGTVDMPEVVDKTTGTMYGFGEASMETDFWGGGAGGSGELMRFTFRSKSATEPSSLDLVHTGMVLGTIDISARVTNAAGVTNVVDVADDGYYVERGDWLYFDYVSGLPTVIDSLWLELSQDKVYRIDAHEDTIANGALDVSEKIDMTELEFVTTVSGFVDWVNPTPKPGDGLTDLIVKVPAVPEFPLGLGLIMLIAPSIPIVYLWRTRKKVMDK